MRMSCNGCRILRKGCSDNCSIRPCLQWIKNPDSQANATLFLAKFYGRAGLVNLIGAGPENLRPAIFRSLLYEACGRIVNPIYGSGGLLWSGSWHLCQAAVEAVLKGAPIMQAPADSAAAVCQSPPLWACNVRHVPRERSSEGSRDRHKVKTRSRFKRSAAKPKPQAKLETNPDSGSDSNLRGGSHVSGLSPPWDPNGETDRDSIFSVETVEASLVSRATEQVSGEEDELKLELSIGLQPSLFKRAHSSATCKRMSGPDGDTCKMEVGLDYPA